MRINTYRKIFGVGPTGAILSLTLFFIAWWGDRIVGHPVITIRSGEMRVIGVLFVVAGSILHLWTFVTLKRWWSGNQLCTAGPFQWFRHPMYAAWVTFISLGVSLLLNSWVFLGWYIVLHPIWHRLVLKEEKMMADSFGDAYQFYKARTGRFIPKI